MFIVCLQMIANKAKWPSYPDGHFCVSWREKCPVSESGDHSDGRNFKTVMPANVGFKADV